jgi:ADP-ribosylglycohydrolase
MNIADRAAGAVIGALVGDALGVGPHWYYDLTELRKDYRDWITGYTAPRPGRYHGGMTPGQLSQTGLIIVMLLRSGGRDQGAP